MKRRVDFLFWRNKALIAFYLLMFIFGPPILFGFSQELDKVQIDYDALFEKGIKKASQFSNDDRNSILCSNKKQPLWHNQRLQGLVG